MKAGILTFHKSKNYGAVLQAYALITILKKLGVDPCIINRYEVTKSLFYKVYFLIHPKHILFRLSWIKFDDFSKYFLTPITKKYTSNKNLKHFQNNENINIAIVGSDQVWRMEYSNIGYNYFFDFLSSQKVKKISYAASFGKEVWKENEIVTSHVKQLLSEFHCISVREKSGVKICNDIFQVNSTNVVDPTLLLDRIDYEKLLLNDVTKRKTSNFVSYILDNKEAIKYCNQFANTNDYSYTDLYHVYPFWRFLSKPHFGLKNYFHLTVPEWLSQIKNAEYFVTNSFHATIFAIMFKKQFLVFDNPSGGSDRLLCLLDLLGLQNRFISKIQEISLDLFISEIDWEKVDCKISLERDFSTKYLYDALFKEDKF